MNGKNMIWGFVLIIIGLLVGLKALGLLTFDIFFTGWWTLFIIIPCFIGLIKDEEKTGSIIGIILGVALLLAARDIIAFDLIWKLALPVILILIGVSIIFKDTKSINTKKEIKDLNTKNTKEQKEYYATFSNQNLDFTKEKFTGCSLNAIFGGVKCDLRNAIMKKDVVIDTCSVFGGITIYVPENVKVKIVSISIFGGVDNKVKEPEKESITIYINANCLFGAVEIK